MGKIFSKPKTPPPPPPPAPPKEMPVADDKQVSLDKKKQAASRAMRSGRVSTILSQGDGGSLGAGG